MEDTTPHSVKDMTNQHLLEEYTYAVQRNHYDPVTSRPPLFSLDELEQEMQERLEKSLGHQEQD